MKISCVQVVWVGPQGSRTRESEGEGVCALQLHELDAHRVTSLTLGRKSALG